MNPFILIGGPTASGKSSLGIQLARDFSGAVLSADAVQVYREAEIGSAKVNEEERALVPHFGLDLCSPEESFDAAQYCSYADSVLANLEEREQQAFIVGGSTMYIKLLIEGIADLPKKNPSIRARLESRSTDSLQRLIHRLDTDSAERLHQNDRLRIIRALEILLVSGETIGSLQEKQKRETDRRKGLLILLWWPRQMLYDRINGRSRRMVASGLLEETQQILDRYPETALVRSLGYAQAKAVLEGEAEEASLVTDIAQATRRYAKRQMTFWRNEPVKLSWQVFPKYDDADAILGDDGIVSMNRSGNPLKGMPVMSLAYRELKERVAERIKKPFETCEVWHLDATRIMETM